MPSNCHDCVKLWRQYAVATRVHVQLENELADVELDSEPKITVALTLKVEDAAAEREELREAIQLHERQAHGVLAVNA